MGMGASNRGFSLSPCLEAHDIYVDFGSVLQYSPKGYF